MSEKRGCFKTGCLGCLGVLAVGILFLAVTALVAWRGAADRDPVEREITAPAEAVPGVEQVVVPGEAAEAQPAGKGGKLVLLFSQGEFHLHAGEPGEPLTIKANFDDDIYNLEDKFESLPDSTWVYQVRFYRTIGGLQALLRQIVAGGGENSVHVYIPPDEPIELVIESEEGGFEAELGGLWLTSADIRFRKGGFAMEISEPLREPMSRLVIHSSMGGFDAEGLGNASPAALLVRASMGGAAIDLNGQWLNDCDADLSIKMGGMAVIVPPDMLVEGAEVGGGEMRAANPEVPRPVLRLKVAQSMGEVDVSR